MDFFVLVFTCGWALRLQGMWVYDADLKIYTSLGVGLNVHGCVCVWVWEGGWVGRWVD